MDDEKIKEFKEKQTKQKAERNYNFFRPVGQFIEHVDTVNFSMDKDGNFQFENVGQVNGSVPNQQSNTISRHEGNDEMYSNEELFKYIHPKISSDQEWQIHEEVKRLITRQGIQEICQYLQKMSNEGNILLPQSAEAAYTELVRMGMPDTDGFSIKTFMKYYRK